jgi:hypothetical protein
MIPPSGFFQRVISLSIFCTPLRYENECFPVKWIVVQLYINRQSKCGGLFLWEQEKQRGREWQKELQNCDALQNCSIRFIQKA